MKTINFCKFIVRRFSIVFKPISPSLEPIQQNQFNKDNIWINKSILKSRNCKETINIASKNLQKMNLINLSTTLKTLLNFEKEFSSMFERKDFIKSLITKTSNIIIFQNISELEARTVSNLYFYFNKLCDNAKLLEGLDELDLKFNKLLEEKIIILIDKMNDQEISNVVYTMAKLKNIEKLLVLSEMVSKKVEFFSFKSNIVIFYSYTSLDIEAETLYKALDNWFINKAKLEKISAQDFANLVFSYSKIIHIIPESTIFDSFNKVYVFFYEEMSIIGISTIVNSLTKFNKPIMCSEFYEKYEPKILGNLSKLSDRLLSNIVRGYARWNYGTDIFYIKLEEKCIERCDFLDEMSFSTILHSYASVFKGSFKFYSSFEKSLLKRYADNPSSLSNNNLLFIFYSFIHVKDTYACSEETQLFFKRIIIERLDQYSFDVLSPFTAMYSSYFKENEAFFQTLKKCLIKKNAQIFRIKNVAEISKSFSLHAVSCFDNELVKYFVKNLQGILNLEGKNQMKLDNNDQIIFFQDLGKILFSLIKYEHIKNYIEVYQQAANLLEDICKNNPDNASILFQEESFGYFFKQSFLKMNINIEFLKEFLKS